MHPDSDQLRVLNVFAHYGMSKTSMSDLAEAAGVSRQTLYNRFKTKEDLLQWAITRVGETSAELALAALSDVGTPQDRIVNFFTRWVGDHVSKIHHTPHGSEIFEVALTLKQENPEEPASAVRCRTALVQFFLNTGMTKADAEEAVFTLRVAAKGLLLLVKDTEAFAEGMRRVVNVTVSRH